MQPVLVLGAGMLDERSCPDCDRRIAVGFSCKARSVCPSCAGRRMASTSADLIDHVLPERAPLRQLVLTLPFELRARLAFDGALCGEVCRTFVDSVMGWYRRHMAALEIGRASCRERV